MTTAVLQVPYDSGHRDARMGRGPGHLMDAGLRERVRAAGDTPVPTRVVSDHEFPREISTTFELAGKLAGDVARARRDGAFPLTVSGMCSAALGMIGGLADVPRLGVVWLDAHTDMNTPQVSVTGFLDGMPLATALGWTFQTIGKSVPGWEPLPENRVLHGGARQFDPGDKVNFEASGLHKLDPAEWRKRGLVAVEPPLTALARQVDAVYLHIDIDVHDPEEACANCCYAAGGPSRAQVYAAAQRVLEQVPVVGASLTCLDPDYDTDGAATAAALDLAALIVGRVSAR